MNKKQILIFSIVLFLSLATFASAHQPRLIFLQKGDVAVSNPELSQAFYDELTGKPKDYFIQSDKDFELYLNLLVPASSNPLGRYSADMFDSQGQKIATLDGDSADWPQFYEDFGRDYYLKGPEFSKQVGAGKYKVEVYSKDNLGKYVLAVGKKESYGWKALLNIYWQLPLLKLEFFKTDVLQFFLTPFSIGGIAAIGALLVLLAILNYIIGVIKTAIRHRQAKTLLLTSAGMEMKNEIIKLLQKPAYDVTVAFISTAAKPQENVDYVKRDWETMKELGFNLEEVDIDGKNERQVMNLLKMRDIIFVEGGNTFYLLKAMRACKFEKVIRKLLKEGKVYIGVSAGSIVAGRTIKSAGWPGGDENIVKLKNLKGLNLVPFDIFVHYMPEDDEIIKKNLPWRWQRNKLKIITDQQAILVQGKEVDLIGH